MAANKLSASSCKPERAVIEFVSKQRLSFVMGCSCTFQLLFYPKQHALDPEWRDVIPLHHWTHLKWSSALEEQMEKQALAASNFLKTAAHDGRLKILCFLMSGEKCVTEICKELSFRQAAASQHISRLRLEGLISGRRQGREIYYSISDAKVPRLIGLLYDLFCSDNGQQ